MPGINKRNTSFLLQAMEEDNPPGYEVLKQYFAIKNQTNPFLTLGNDNGAPYRGYGVLSMPQTDASFDDSSSQRPAEPGFAERIANSLKGVGQSVLAGYYNGGARLYHGLGNALDGVNTAGDWLVDTTGSGEKAAGNGSAGARNWLHEAALMMQAKAAETMPKNPNFLEKTYAGMGAAPVDMARILTLSRLPGGMPTAFGLDAGLQNIDQGLDVAAWEAGKAALLGGIQKATGSLTTGPRVAINAAVPVVQGLASGTPAEDMAANAILGGGMAVLPTGGGVTAREVLTGANRRPIPEPALDMSQEVILQARMRAQIAKGLGFDPSDAAIQVNDPRGAIVHWFDTRYIPPVGVVVPRRDVNTLGHWGIETEHEGTSLFTHQAGRPGTYAIIRNEFPMDLTESFPIEPSKSVAVGLPNAMAAQAYQKELIDKVVGRYDPKDRNCQKHVGEVLNAGGAKVPTDPMELYRYLRDIGAYPSGRK